MFLCKGKLVCFGNYRYTAIYTAPLDWILLWNKLHYQGICKDHQFYALGIYFIEIIRGLTNNKMENEAYEMDGFENGHRTNGNLAHDEANQNGFHLNGKSRDYDGEGGALVSNGKPLPHAEESRRYDVVKDLAQTGNGPKLDALLAEWEDLGWLRDWRNEDGLTLYADAITDGYIGRVCSLFVLVLVSFPPETSAG